MVLTYDMAISGISDYANPKNKLARMVKSGKLYKLRRALYADSRDTPPRVIAACLYGPSYLSFQYALAAHGLIPERVNLLTSASFRKTKTKTYHTPLGDFIYYPIPSLPYPYGLVNAEEDGAGYLMAGPEKALCDMVYKTPEVSGARAMNALLLEDWRIEEGDLRNLDSALIRQIAPLYKRKSLLALAAWFGKRR
jgi:hypothetical protein